MSAPTVITSANITFGSDTYKVKSMPAGKPQTADPVDVTCLDDAKKQFVPGALKVNGEISIVVAGVSAPALNDEQTLTLTLGASTVTMKAIAKSIEPGTIETDGTARERTWTVTFQPTGNTVSAG